MQHVDPVRVSYLRKSNKNAIIKASILHRNADHVYFSLPPNYLEELRHRIEWAIMSMTSDILSEVKLRKFELFKLDLDCITHYAHLNIWRKN